MDPAAIAREALEDLKTGLGSILANLGPPTREDIEPLYSLAFRALQRLDRGGCSETLRCGRAA